MKVHWLYSLLVTNKLVINEIVSSSLYTFIQELLQALQEWLGEYIWGEQPYPPQPMCFPEDEAKIVIPGLHRMVTNHTIDYVVYKETYTPSEYPPMVVTQPFGFLEEFDYMELMIELALTLISVLYPNLPAALRTAPLGRRASLVISPNRVCRLLGDTCKWTWSFMGSMGFMGVELILPLLLTIATTLPYILLPILIFYFFCKCKIFTYLASVEDAVRPKVIHYAEEVKEYAEWVGRRLALVLAYIAVFMGMVYIQVRYFLPFFPYRLYIWLRDDYFGYLIPGYFIELWRLIREGNYSWDTLYLAYMIHKITIGEVIRQFWVVLWADGVLERSGEELFEAYFE